jgi:hypothetical protein
MSDRSREQPFGPAASTTYAVPEAVPEGGWPTPRTPDIRLRLVPNESMLIGEYSPFEPHLGELVQELIVAGADYGVSVEVDTSDRTRPGEMRGGASPAEAIALVVLGDIGGRLLDQVIDRLIGTMLDWALRHRAQDKPEPMIVDIYGPDGALLKQIQVPQDGRDPFERAL